MKIPEKTERAVDALSSFKLNNATIALPKLKIVHVSDLHFVAHPLLKLFEPIKGLRGHDNDTLAALENEVVTLKPDLLFVTGDQTTWGDKRSLRAARAFILNLAKRAELNKTNVFWIPGNHDILLHYYFGTKLLRRNHEVVFGKLEPCQHLTASKYTVGVFSFDSTLDRQRQRSALWPLVGSRGKISRGSFNEFNKAVKNTATAGCHFKIALVHHHPLPIPYKAEGSVGLELTTMTNGGTFIAHMQESGINLVLHGHEHYPYSCRYSFDPNSNEIIIVAAGSATQRGTEQNSFNYLEIVPNIRIVVRKYNYTETGFRRDSAKVFTFKPVIRARRTSQGH